jgi:hypothetical protein
MKLTFKGITTLALAFTTIGVAQAASIPVIDQAQLTTKQEKQLAEQARTPNQFGTLAEFYGKQQKQYLAQAAEERQEWARRSANVTGPAAKYPRPVDSAHYLYDYYTYKAKRAGELAAKYSRQTNP